MTISPTQLIIDSTVKKEVEALFSRLGLDMSSAVNIFLHQCVLHGSLPFEVELPKFNQETLKVIAESKKISRDKNVQRYSSVKELFNALDEE